MDFSILKNITSKRIQKIKNNWIWIRIGGEIKKENWSRRERKTRIKSKINLIYDSKLKSNAISR